MIINIRVTDKAIEWIMKETGLEEEDAGELAQMVVNLCDKSGAADLKDFPIGYRLRRAARDLIEYRRGAERHGDYLKELEKIQSPAHNTAEGEGKIGSIILDPEELDKLISEAWEGERVDIPLRLRLLSKVKRAIVARLEEGEGSADNLYKTAFYMVKYYNEVGGSRFRARFGSLKVLDVCKKIIEEGEGNPHPWE
jgi:hypothetical protein